MRFIDEAIIEVAAGDGGNGCVSFLRERFRPKGGPDGGDGGRGGHVYIQATRQVATLADHSYLRHFRAKRGQHGMGSDKYGRAGEDKVISVPVGTQVFDVGSGKMLFDLARDREEVIVARGGAGGRGNRHFASSINRAPRQAEPGGEGERFILRLDLKLLAEVGLVGLPNAGKSSLIRAASAARPKVADYPFTTLTPNLGVVQVPGWDPFTMADIPGLIAGAHKGAGLGLKFLKHVERSRLFVYVVDLSGDDPEGDLLAVKAEVEAYDPGLAGKASLVAANKVDLEEAAFFFQEFKRKVEPLGLTVMGVSALTGSGMPDLLQAIAQGLGEWKESKGGESSEKL